MMKAEWIWYPGEFETYTLNRVQSRRSLRDIPQPPVWRSHGVYPSVKFCKEFTLKGEDELLIRASGPFDLELDRPGNFVKEQGGKLRLSAGRHSLCIHVFCVDGFPAVYVSGRELSSGRDWMCTLLDGVFVPVDCGGFTEENADPNKYSLPVSDLAPVCSETENGATMYDFGAEQFGYVRFGGSNGKGKLHLFYGESREEAEDAAGCEQIDALDLSKGQTRTPVTRAFRYLRVVREGGADYLSCTAECEYHPQPFTASFRSSEGIDGAIWETAVRTFSLNTREFFLDGIKRDRWVWSGDATQSYLINKYCFFDLETERRTTVALAGKGEVRQHFNTITDYTLYWLISFYDSYRYTGDISFVRRWGKRFEEVLGFCLNRTDGNGFLLSPKGEWVFIDWNDALTKDSECYAFLQMLLYGALRAAEKVFGLLNNARAEECAARAAALKEKIAQVFWDEGRGGFSHSLIGGRADGLILKQTNIMAVLQGVATEEQKNSILHNVLCNPDVPPITTPYMRFYEFAALCELGEKALVIEEMRRYFGGMLECGATTFWEQFDPSEKGEEKYAMYGRKYGKSLCHAWGATAIYIIGRYLVGLEPEEDGYERFRLSPAWDVLGDFCCDFPLKEGGHVRLCRRGEEVEVQSTRNGTLTLKDRTVGIAAGREVLLTLNDSKK